MYILGVHTGGHDASACLYRDFDLIAAVSLERLTRAKGAGVTTDEPMPDRAIDECLAIAGVGRALQHGSGAHGWLLLIFVSFAGAAGCGRP